MSYPNKGIGYRGIQEPNSAGDAFNAQSFLVRSILSRIATSTLVQVVAVTNAGGVEPVGFVDVRPMVNQIDGIGNAVPHGVIFRCPYQRIQGGVSAVILDPAVGDIGAAVFTSSDISSVIANRAVSNPGSRRKFDLADCLYLGGHLNAAPTQYVQFSAAGIAIHSPTQVVLSGPEVSISAPVVSINASTSVDITTPSLMHNGVNIGSGHVHGGVEPGGSDTTGPH